MGMNEKLDWGQTKLDRAATHWPICDLNLGKMGGVGWAEPLHTTGKTEVVHSGFTAAFTGNSEDWMKVMSG